MIRSAHSGRSDSASRLKNRTPPACEADGKSSAGTTASMATSSRSDSACSEFFIRRHPISMGCPMQGAPLLPPGQEAFTIGSHIAATCGGFLVRSASVSSSRPGSSLPHDPVQRRTRSGADLGVTDGVGEVGRRDAQRVTPICG